MKQLLHFTALFSFLLLAGCSSGSDDAPVSEIFWEEVSPESVGLDGGLLGQLTTNLDNGSLGKVSSLLIIRNGKLAYEHYRLGMDPNQQHVIYSVTKSISSGLIGMAIAQHGGLAMDDKLLDYFPEYTALQNPNALKSDIEVQHVLQMRAGFEWDEGTHNYGHPQNSVTGLINSADWPKHVLDQPMANASGETFTYNSGCTVLLSSLIEKTTGKSAEDFAKENLFNPLGITSYTWQKGANNLTNTGFGLSMRARDMAKIGQLYLDKGMWQGNRIIDESWIDLSFTPYSDFASGGGYGLQWWLYNYEYPTGAALIPYANGHGNQFIFIIEPYDMVAVITSENFERAPSSIVEILTTYILGSAE